MLSDIHISEAQREAEDTQGRRLQYRGIESAQQEARTGTREHSGATPGSRGLMDVFMKKCIKLRPEGPSRILEVRNLRSSS